MLAVFPEKRLSVRLCRLQKSCTTTNHHSTRQTNSDSPRRAPVGTKDINRKEIQGTDGSKPPSAVAATIFGHKPSTDNSADREWQPLVTHLSFAAGLSSAGDVGNPLAYASPPLSSRWFPLGISSTCPPTLTGLITSRIQFCTILYA